MLKQILLLVVLASVLSSCGTTDDDKEIEVAIEKACETVINVNGGVSVSGGAGTAFAELARLDARYLPLLISFSDWWQAHIVYDVSGFPTYPPFPDALVNFCKA